MRMKACAGYASGSWTVFELCFLHPCRTPFLRKNEYEPYATADLGRRKCWPRPSHVVVVENWGVTGLPPDGDQKETELRNFSEERLRGLGATILHREDLHLVGAQWQWDIEISKNFLLTHPSEYLRELALCSCEET